MKIETDAVLVVFWRCAEMVQRWHRPVGRSVCESHTGDKEDAMSNSRQSGISVDVSVCLCVSVRKFCAKYIVN